MALQKTIELENGTSGNYLKITHISLSKNPLKLNIVLSLFKNETFSHAAPIKILKGFNFSITTLESKGDLCALGYEKIKTLNDNLVNGAVDI